MTSPIAQDQQQDQQERSAERSRLLVESARDYAMFTLDAQGRIDSWNPGAQRILGYAEEEILGKPGDLIFTPEDRTAGAPEQEMNQALQEGRAEDERWHMKKDSSRFWASGVMTVLTDKAGVFIGFAKVLRDLTERQQYEEALKRAKEELEQRVQERTAELTAVHQIRQDLLRRLVHAQEAERGRISRELHDVTGQIVTALLLGLGTLRGQSLPEKTLQSIQNLYALAQELSEQSHRLSFTLRPTALDDLGLVMALRNHVEQWSQWNSLTVDLETVGWEILEGDPTVHTRLTGDIETTIYRIVQEALTNISRHARGEGGATHVNILLEYRSEQVIAIVEDNGPGFDVAAVQNRSSDERRLGLFGMEERAALVGGTLILESEPGKGTTVLLRIPLAGE